MTPSQIGTIESIGWVLLHFLWQGAAVGAVLQLALTLAARRRAEVRYALASLALVLLLVLPMVTAVRLARADDQFAMAPVVPRDALGATVSGGPASQIESRRPLVRPSSGGEIGRPSNRAWTLAIVRRAIDPVLPWVVLGWALGVGLLSMRLAGGWWRARVLRTRDLLQAPPACLDLLGRLSRRISVARTVALAVSRSLTTPIVVGHLKPVILLPAAALAGLSASQLEAILAHELAHVRRHDYLVNLAQTVIETLLFYHPAVWWVSRQVRIEREHCCDDIAVEACGDRRTYVKALLGLEQLRQPAFLLAPGAADGSLLARAKRLLATTDDHASSPRLAASLIALTVAAVAVAGVSTSSKERALTVNTGLDQTAITTKPSTPAQPSSTLPLVPVLTAPKVDDSLPARWAWAEADARTKGFTQYWVGYTIRPVASLTRLVYFDRDTVVMGNNMTISGHILTDGDGLRFPGRRLDLPGSASGVKLLFAFDRRSGAPRLTRAHGSSVDLAIDVRDLPVLWLGAAGSRESLERVGGLYARAGTSPLKKDVMSAVALHDDSPAVVAWLNGRIAANEPDDVRADAAEWLGWHPIPAALESLERIARTDRTSRVRQEAAEALGDLAMPGATDVLVALASSLTDLAARLEAVEALGNRPELRARDALAAIARQDGNLDIQREAVESLGDFEDQRGVPALIELARTHANVEVRREAVETLGDTLPSDTAMALLKQVALEDADVRVQEEAVDALANLDHETSLATLMELARTHANSDVRREAVEALAHRASGHEGKDAANASADAGGKERLAIIELLNGLASEDRDHAVRIEAVETLGELPGREPVERLRALSASHADADVRREAIETLAEHAEPTEALVILRETIEKDVDRRVKIDAVERLANVQGGGGRAALVDLARTHKDEDVRAEAVESLADCAPATDTADILKGIAERDASRRVRDEAIETLADLPDGAGVPALIEIARSHADQQARRNALEALMDSDHPGARAIFDRALRK